jgi:hypothetical protein
MALTGIGFATRKDVPEKRRKLVKKRRTQVFGFVAALAGATSLLAVAQAPPAAPSGLRILTAIPPGTPPAPSTGTRLYAADSVWNTPIPANPEIDANSAVMARAVADAARTGGLPITVKEWSWPLYFADAATPRYTIGLTAWWAPAKFMIGVPIPSHAQPDPAGDGQMAIVDLASRCEYDFFQGVKDQSGNWTASWANATSIDGTGWFPPGGYSATGAGRAGAAGLMRPEEFQAGVILHALHFAFPLTKAGGPVLPAGESDGQSTAVGAIPEGARLQLDPSVDLSTLGLNSYEMIVGRALQQYGMFLTTTNYSGVSFAAQNPISTSVGYPWGDQTYVYLPVSLVARLRVLKLGPQYQPTSNLNNTACAAFK